MDDKSRRSSDRERSPTPSLDDKSWRSPTSPSLDDKSRRSFDGKEFPTPSVSGSHGLQEDRGAPED